MFVSRKKIKQCSFAVKLQVQEQNNEIKVNMTSVEDSVPIFCISKINENESMTPFSQVGDCNEMTRSSA